MTSEPRSGCACAPTRDGPEPPTVAAAATSRRRPRLPADAVLVPAGTFVMGTDAPVYPGDGEAPARRVSVERFAIDRAPVRHAAFASFVAATGYVTDAERHGGSFVFFDLVAPADRAAAIVVPGLPWWRYVPGAMWAHPFGPSHDPADHDDHPVVHVSWRDAVAYADWVGGRLPTEAEWEYAGHGGRTAERPDRFPWGDVLEPGGVPHANVWRGPFPERAGAHDDGGGTTRVGSYPPNGLGLVDVVGNVWEWTADPFLAGATADAPRVRKGGSYLCHASYCARYRLQARSAGAIDDASGNVGFRLAYDLP